MAAARCTRWAAPRREADAVMKKELEALLARSDKDRSPGVALAKEAAAAEDRLNFEFGPPLVKPAHELAESCSSPPAMPPERGPSSRSRWPEPPTGRYRCSGSPAPRKRRATAPRRLRPGAAWRTSGSTPTRTSRTSRKSGDADRRSPPVATGGLLALGDTKNDVLTYFGVCLPHPENGTDWTETSV